jgi:hypothetical protein
MFRRKLLLPSSGRYYPEEQHRHFPCYFFQLNHSRSFISERYALVCLHRINNRRFFTKHIRYAKGPDARYSEDFSSSVLCGCEALAELDPWSQC